MFRRLGARVGYDGALALALPCVGAGVLLEAHLRTSVADAEPAAACRYASNARLLTEARVAALARDGFVVIPGVVAAERVAAARADAGCIHAERGERSLAVADERRDDVCWIRASDGTPAAASAPLRGCAPLG